MSSKAERSERRIIHYLIEVKDHSDQVRLERRLGGEGGYAFIDAGESSYQSLEEAEIGVRAEMESEEELKRYENEYGDERQSG